MAIVGYIGSYTPSLLAWWEQTWYPHGREARVVNPGTDSAAYTLFLPGEVIDDAMGNQESEAKIGEPSVMFLKQLPLSPTNQTTQEHVAAKDQTLGQPEEEQRFLNHANHLEMTTDVMQGWSLKQKTKRTPSDRQS